MSNEHLLVICNGPSVAELVETGFDHLPPHVDTVGCSLAYRYFEEVNWWPTYYCLTDPKVLLHHQDAFQKMILDKSNGIKKFVLCTELPQLGLDIKFEDPHDRIIQTAWQVTGQAAFKVCFRFNYKYLYLIGCDNRYFWDHSLVKALPNQSIENNRAMVLEDVPENPNYGIPNYLRKGDITSWLFNHPDKTYSTSSGNEVWGELVESALNKNIEVYDFSNGNLPIENKLPSVINYFNYGKAS